MSQDLQNNTDFQLSPGENNVYGDRFIPTLLTPYLKTQLMCSSTRFVYKSPNTLLGLIPVGTEENTFPLRNIAAVSSNTVFLLKNFIFGLILLFGGYYMAAEVENGFLGFLLFVWGVATLFMSFPMGLKVTNPAGGTTEITISILEKAKLKRFVTELQNRVYTDQSQINHMEAQQMRMQQIALQQMQMQQMQLDSQANRMQTPPEQQGFAQQ